MGRNTKIAWADNTFNPWIGCTKVGPGCDNCYANELDKHYSWTPDGWGAGNPRHRTAASTWKQPFKWNREAEKSQRRLTVFSASLADIFDNEINPSWRADFFRVVQQTLWIDWIVLTKRIGNVAKMLPEDWGPGYFNVWLCITTVNQEEINRDWPKLESVPAAVKGLSVEPQIEHIYLKNAGPDWVISGAESGGKRRPYKEDWARSLRDQCTAREIPFFYKQNLDGKK